MLPSKYTLAHAMVKLGIYLWYLFIATIVFSMPIVSIVSILKFLYSDLPYLVLVGDCMSALTFLSFLS